MLVHFELWEVIVGGVDSFLAEWVLFEFKLVLFFGFRVLRIIDDKLNRFCLMRVVGLWMGVGFVVGGGMFSFGFRFFHDLADNLILKLLSFGAIDDGL